MKVSPAGLKAAVLREEELQGHFTKDKKLNVLQ